MQAIIFTGIQASGKSSLYKSYFFNTHVRISLDLLNTRNKEWQLLEKCVELQQRVVIDNTNPTTADRKKYIDLLKSRKYEIIGYYFQSNLHDAIQRNAHRSGKEKIPEVGIRATHKKLELPSLDEGFDRLYYVELTKNGFKIKDWNNEI